MSEDSDENEKSRGGKALGHRGSLRCTSEGSGDNLSADVHP